MIDYSLQARSTWYDAVLIDGTVVGHVAKLSTSWAWRLVRSDAHRWTGSYSTRRRAADALVEMVVASERVGSAQVGPVEVVYAASVCGHEIVTVSTRREVLELRITPSGLIRVNERYKR
jgi:hypothetical protein